MWNLFGTKGIKIKDLEPLVAGINAEYETLFSLSNDELRSLAKELGDQIQTELSECTQSISALERQLDAGNDLDVIQQSHLYTEIENKRKEKYEKSEAILKKYIPQAFAILKNTCYRFSSGETVVVTANSFDTQIACIRDYVTIDDKDAVYRARWVAGGKEIRWNMVPYDSQLLAGIVLQYGEIAEMLNGEGKTLAAILPAFLYGIAQRRVHICTANPFLSARDCEWMRPLLEFHGIKVSEIDGKKTLSDEKREAYQATIIYGTADEFGFDYLRDKTVFSATEAVQSELDFVIIDEIDSTLIDEARTPLIITECIEKNDAILQEFELLKPVVTALIDEQWNILDECFELAKEEVQNNDYQTACRYLYIVKRGNPKYNDFYYYVNSTPNVLTKLNRFEKNPGEDNLLERIDKELFFSVVNNKIELSEKGKEFIRKETGEAGFWELPDIDKEMNLIVEKKLNILDEIEEKRRLIDHFEFVEMRHNILEQLIKAYTLFVKDNDYIVVNNSVKIVDQNTGRALQSRVYSDGLHQAIEAKENVPLQQLNQPAATISLQSYFRKYRKLAGMTATAKMDEREYKEIYNKHVIQVPPFKPTIRKDFQDLVYKTKREKIQAIVEQTINLIMANRPVLIGTVTVEDSELISEFLTVQNIPHNVLNAKQDAEEALIISRAGIPRTVTVAAMMAGRGTDIKLTKESITAGGLAVLGFERHETRRLDHQLKGRAGRQGDPGTSQFYLSLQDDLMQMFGSDRIASLMEKLGYKEGEVIQHSMISNSIQRAQRKVEENNLGIRNRLFEYDNTLSIAREGIYQKRNHALSGYRITLDIRLMFDDVSQNIVGISGKAYDKFVIQIMETFDYNTQITPAEFERLSVDELGDHLSIEAYQNYMLKAKKIAAQCFPIMANIRKTQGSHIENVVIPFTGKSGFNVLSALDEAIATLGLEPVKKFQAQVTILVIDKHWKGFLKRYDKIKEDVSLLTAIEKGDPLARFKKDISEYYMELLGEIHYEIVNNLCYMHIPVTANSREEAMETEEAEEITYKKEEDSMPAEDEADEEAEEQNDEAGKSELIVSDEIIRSNAGLCFQVNGKDITGRPAWYFVLLREEKKEAFLARKTGDSYDIADYGSIIASGYGETVPDEIKEQLRERYGFDNF